ncbi:MAG: ABC transporter permease [Anaerolineae bacterium]|nr:ABC transporter permease [Anaerolineae bacterium]
MFQYQLYLGGGLVGFFLFLAIAAPFLAPPPPDMEFSPYKDVVNARGFQPHPPGTDTLLGTVYNSSNGFQLDIWYSLVWGARSAMIFGVAVVGITATIGVLFGAVSAMIGGVTDIIGMGFTDAFLAFPIIAGVVFFHQFLLALLRSSGDVLVYANNLVFFTHEATPFQNFLMNTDPIGPAFVLFSWMPYARVINSVVVRIRKELYVQAAKALGASSLRQITRHIIPNSISPALALGARDIGYFVLLQVGFAFIGLTDRSVWGVLLSAGRNWIIGPNTSPLAYWWVFIPTTLAIILFGIGWNLLGDVFNDWFSQRTR